MFDFDKNNIGEIEAENLSVEQVMLDTDAGGLHSSLGMRSALPALRPIAALVLVGFLLLTLRLVDLQIARGNALKLSAEGNRVRTLQQFAPRGLILDRNGELIARNIPSFELVAVPFDLPEEAEARKSLLTQAGQIIGLSFEEIEERLNLSSLSQLEPILIKQSLVQEEALKLEGLTQQNTGLVVQNAPIREYLDGEVFANIVGFTGKLNAEEWQSKRSSGYFFNDVIGKTGIELIYEEHLRGEHGGTQVEVDAEGRVVKKIRDIEPTTGADLKLTVDAGLQKNIYESLTATLKRVSSATGASAVAMNPKTGEVLALVTLPSFDNNLFARGIKTDEYQELLNEKNKPMLNRPIAGSYPPGSTIKPVVAAAALEEGVITKNTKVNDEGVIRVGSYTYYGWKREGLGIMDVISAIAWSSDPFFYVVGGGHSDYKIEGLGVDKLERYLRMFNLGQKLGINLPGEVGGFVPSRAWKKQYFAGTDEQNWYLGNTYHLAIGQGYLLTTPLQVAGLTAAIANGGKLMRPVLTFDAQKEQIASLSVSEQNLEIVQTGMREVVSSGTSKILQDVGVAVAGKTGTAQFDPRNPASTHAWYTAYAPYEDPEIVITVMVEAGGEGSSVAAPVAREALKWWLENRD